MPISGLVLTLDEDADHRARAHAALQQMPNVQLGVASGRKLPAVTDTPDAEEAEALFERLRTTAGVCFVDVLSVDFTEDQEGYEP
jgi:hypothetical protein